MKNLLYLKDLRKDEINQLLDLSDHYLNSKSSHEFENLLKNQSIASLFFEPSTRTSASFQVAAKRLGAETIIIDEKKSSAIENASDLGKELCNFQIQPKKNDVIFLKLRCQ